MPDDEKDLAFDSPPIPDLSEAGQASLDALAEEIIGVPKSQDAGSGDPIDDTETKGAEEADSSESEETPGKLEIDSANISQGISALISSNPEFANIFKSRVGQAAASKYLPKIEQLNTDLASERGQKLVERVDGMTAEERGQLMTNEPKTAVQYAVAKEALQNPSAGANLRQLRTSIVNLSSMALEKGMPQKKLDEFLVKANTGGYDLDEQGQEHLDWTGAYHLLEREVMSELLDSRPSAVTKPPANSNGKPADTASPDMGSARRSSDNSSPAKYTLAEVRKMNPEQQFEAFGEEENAIEKAIQAGIITEVSEATSEVLGIT